MSVSGVVRRCRHASRGGKGDRRKMSAALPSGLVGPVQVALARAVERIPRSGGLPGGCRFEPKWDGFRLIITRVRQSAHLWSRRGTDLSETFPEIVTSCTDQLSPGTVLDGEVVIWSTGRLDFGALQTRMGRASRGAATHAASHPRLLRCVRRPAPRGPGRPAPAVRPTSALGHGPRPRRLRRVTSTTSVRPPRPQAWPGGLQRSGTGPRQVRALGGAHGRRGDPDRPRRPPVDVHRNGESPPWRANPLNRGYSPTPTWCAFHWVPSRATRPQPRLGAGPDPAVTSALVADTVRDTVACFTAGLTRNLTQLQRPTLPTVARCRDLVAMWVPQPRSGRTEPFLPPATRERHGITKRLASSPTNFLRNRRCSAASPAEPARPRPPTGYQTWSAAFAVSAGC
ncbi:hypothetical protein ACIGB8_22440 [Promicromonospora sukumoe]|uniref:ATP-dependent DNA ligase n=1 Tax=Promicromonospora sukumoe TaxID=88382 RepID=UPI0037C750C4